MNPKIFRPKTNLDQITFAKKIFEVYENFAFKNNWNGKVGRKDFLPKNVWSKKIVSKELGLENIRFTKLSVKKSDSILIPLP